MDDKGPSIYCPMCGADRDVEARYCRRCGYDLRSPPEAAGDWKRQRTGQWPDQTYYQPSYGQPYLPKKEPIVAALLSFLLFGIGQIYVGKVTRGLIILVAGSVLSVVFVVGLMALGGLSSYGMWYGVSPSGTILIWSLAFVVALLVFDIWQIYDAYKCAERLNKDSWSR